MSNCPKTGGWFPSKEYHDANCLACKPWKCVSCGNLVDKKLIWHGKCDDCQSPEERAERDREIKQFLSK